MASPIIAAVRQRRDLKESVLHTCIELGHRASVYGVVRVSLRYLAKKCNCCVQTIINHLKKLQALKIISKQRCRIRGSAYFEINVYTFGIDWAKTPAQTGISQKNGAKFPQREEGEKHASLETEIKNLEKGMRFLTPGTVAYEASQEKLARLIATYPPMP